MKVSKRFDGLLEVPPLIPMDDIRDMDDDNNWERHMRTMRFDDDTSEDQYDYDIFEDDNNG